MMGAMPAVAVTCTHLLVLRLRLGKCPTRRILIFNLQRRGRVPRLGVSSRNRESPLLAKLQKRSTCARPPPAAHRDGKRRAQAAGSLCWLLFVRPFSPTRSEEHTSELQSLMRISYAVFCLKTNTTTSSNTNPSTTIKPDA